MIENRFFEIKYATGCLVIKYCLLKIQQFIFLKVVCKNFLKLVESGNDESDEIAESGSCC